MLQGPLFGRAVEQLWNAGDISGEMHPGSGREAIAGAMVSQLIVGEGMALDPHAIWRRRPSPTNVEGIIAAGRRLLEDWMASIAIVTDTDASLPAALAEQHDIRQIPVGVPFSEIRYLTPIDNEDASVFEGVDAEGALTRTSAAAPGDSVPRSRRLSTQKPMK